jgi:hypothetical protein
MYSETTATAVFRDVTLYNLEQFYRRISLSHRAFQFTIYNGPTNALVCFKTLIQMSYTKTFKSLQHVSIIR